MKYFTTDTHFWHPLVSVLRGFTTFDPAAPEPTVPEESAPAAEPTGDPEITE